MLLNSYFNLQSVWGRGESSLSCSSCSTSQRKTFVPSRLLSAMHNLVFVPLKWSNDTFFYMKSPECKWCHFQCLAYIKKNNLYSLFVLFLKIKANRPEGLWGWTVGTLSFKINFKICNLSEFLENFTYVQGILMRFTLPQFSHIHSS